MPGMDGGDTYDALRLIDPELKVIVFSGYSEPEALRRFTGRQIAGFVPKTYRSNSLAAKVQEVAFDRSAPSQNGAENAAHPFCPTVQTRDRFLWNAECMDTR